MTTSTTPDFNALPEAEQRAVAERLLRIEESGWKPFWCANPNCDGMPHPLLDEHGARTYVSSSEVSTSARPIEMDDEGNFYLIDPAWQHNHARVDQRLPSWLKPWVLFIMSGRGTGKTRTGVEFVTLCARKGLDGAILGRRGTELVNTHVATIIEHAHPDFMPEHLASKDILVWPNGAITYLFSAEKPENIRSVNLSYAWVDEAAFMDEIETAWMNLRLAARKKVPGNPIHILVTSTPTPTEWVMKMEDDEDVEVRRVSTFANRANLDPDYLNMLIKEYKGTRKGRQELEGEVLRDVEGAMWNDDMFKHLRVDDFDGYLDSLDERVIAIDPAGTANKRSDKTGIIGAGARRSDSDGSSVASTFDVLCRATLKGSPTEWAAQAFKAARLIRAHRIIAEKNFGGDMVKQVLADYAKLHPAEACDENGETFRIEIVHATQSKETRAEATVGKYEQGRVTHVTSDMVFGDLSELEKQQTTWVPKSRGGKMPSPNDIDALVWAIRALENAVKFQGQMASQRSVLSKLKRTGARSSGRPTVPTATAARVDTTFSKRPVIGTDKPKVAPVLPPAKTTKVKVRAPKR